MKRVMLTTVDNPYDPFDEFDDWYRYDMDQGYCSCSYLARVAFTSDSLSEAENNREIERAIDEIIQYDFLNLYEKVEKDEEEPYIPELYKTFANFTI